MGKALSLSLLFHLLFFGLVIWSSKLSIQRMKMEIPQLSPVGVVYTELLYKPSNTNMRKGNEKRDLPPPLVKTEKKENLPSLVTQKVAPKKKADEKLSRKQSDAKALLDKLRREEGRLEQKAPKDDNFPTHKAGEEGARGTGGSSRMQASPAQLALQSAMRRYFEFPRASEMRREHPNSVGYFNVSVLGVGNTLQLRDLQMVQSSGFSVLDRSCETAIRKALSLETFAGDVISELSGKSNMIECRF